MAIVLTHKGVRTVHLGRKKEIVESCLGLALDDPGENPKGLLARLERLVVRPLLLDRETTRILVAPDGILALAPFCLLARGREVVYIPSMTTYRSLSARPAGSAKGLLALGNGGLAKADVALEAHTTADKLAAALARNKRWRAIELASEGIMDPEKPSLSIGKLTLADALRTKLDADLVVLSGTRDSSRDVVFGDGPAGVSRALMLAGATRVIVRRWRVSREAALAFLKHFYRLWDGKNMSAATALYKAQQHVRSQKAWEHPSHWAAWQLWGLPD